MPYNEQLHWTVYGNGGKKKMQITFWVWAMKECLSVWLLVVLLQHHMKMKMTTHFHPYLHIAHLLSSKESRPVLKRNNFAASHETFVISQTYLVSSMIMSYVNYNIIYVYCIQQYVVKTCTIDCLINAPLLIKTLPPQSSKNIINARALNR